MMPQLTTLKNMYTVQMQTTQTMQILVQKQIIKKPLSLLPLNTLLETPPQTPVTPEVREVNEEDLPTVLFDKINQSEKKKIVEEGVRKGKGESDFKKFEKEDSSNGVSHMENKIKKAKSYTNEVTLEERTSKNEITTITQEYDYCLNANDNREVSLDSQGKQTLKRKLANHCLVSLKTKKEKESTSSFSKSFSMEDSSKLMKKIKLDHEGSETISMRSSLIADSSKLIDRKINFIEKTLETSSDTSLISGSPAFIRKLNFVEEMCKNETNDYPQEIDVHLKEDMENNEQPGLSNTSSKILPKKSKKSGRKKGTSTDTLTTEHQKYSRHLDLTILIVKLLQDPEYNPRVVSWKDKSTGIFRIENTKEFSKVRGVEYKHIARNMRYHSTTTNKGSGKLTHVPNERLTYQFTEKMGNIWKEE